MIRWDALKHELSDRFFAGPYICPSQRTGQVSESLCFSGLKIEAATSESKLSADILVNDERFGFPLHNLYLLPSQVPFSFHAKVTAPSVIDSTQLVSFVDVLSEIYAYVKAPCDIFDLLSDLEPLLGPRNVGAAPLKRSAFSFLRPDLAEHGFAVTAFKRHTDWVTARVAWVFPKSRTAKPINKYVHVVSVRYLHPRNEISEAEIISPNYNGIGCHLSKRFLKLAGTNLTQWLSKAGQQEVCNSFNGLAAERTLKARQKISFIRSHPELWDSPLGMAKALIAANFYSPKTPASQVAWSCETFIQQARFESSRSV